jgi:type IV secretion system protein VirD4
LSYRGAAIVIDPKGEAAAVTARWRRSIGPVAVVDPFGVVTDDPDQLNPIDVLEATEEATTSVAERALALTELMKADVSRTLSDPYWDNRGSALFSAIIGHVLTRDDERHLGRVREILSRDRLDLWLEQDVLPSAHPFVGEEVRQYLHIPNKQTRPSVLSIAQQHTRLLGDASVKQSLQRTTVDLSALRRGEAATIYLVLPPEKLRSHASLLRVWIGSLLELLLRRRRRPEVDTLLMVDEAAQLGALEGLRTATTLMRGYGLRVWSFWQDLSQLQHLYPADWPTMINNASVLQVFGVSTYRMAAKVAEVIGSSPEQLLDLGAGNAVLAHRGGEIEVARRIDYLTDRPYTGRSDPNPMIASSLPSPEERSPNIDDPRPAGAACSDTESTRAETRETGANRPCASGVREGESGRSPSGGSPSGGSPSGGSPSGGNKSSSDQSRAFDPETTAVREAERLYRERLRSRVRQMHGRNGPVAVRERRSAQTRLVVMPAGVTVTEPTDSTFWQPTLDIYNHYVTTSNVTAERTARTLQQHRAALDRHLINLVVAKDGDIIGFGFLKPFVEGEETFAPTVEIGAYLHSEVTGCGIGPCLARRLTAEARRLGKRSIIAKVNAANVPSIKATKQVGFTEVARLREVAQKKGKRITVVYLQRMLSKETGPLRSNRTQE